MEFIPGTSARIKRLQQQETNKRDRQDHKKEQEAEKEKNDYFIREVEYVCKNYRNTISLFDEDIFNVKGNNVKKEILEKLTNIESSKKLCDDVAKKAKTLWDGQKDIENIYTEAMPHLSWLKDILNTAAGHDQTQDDPKATTMKAPGPGVTLPKYVEMEPRLFYARTRAAQRCKKGGCAWRE